jgi:hypothetical protein
VKNQIVKNGDILDFGGLFWGFNVDVDIQKMKLEEYLLVRLQTAQVDLKRTRPQHSATGLYINADDIKRWLKEFKILERMENQQEFGVE